MPFMGTQLSGALYWTGDGRSDPESRFEGDGRAEAANLNTRQ